MFLRYSFWSALQEEISMVLYRRENTWRNIVVRFWCDEIYEFWLRPIFNWQIKSTDKGKSDIDYCCQALSGLGDIHGLVDVPVVGIHTWSLRRAFLRSLSESIRCSFKLVTYNYYYNNNTKNNTALIPSFWRTHLCI